MSDIPERILRIEPGSVVVPVGAAGSGKTTWVRHNFPAEQVVSLDDFRILMTGADAAPDATAEALELLVQVLQARCARRLTTALDGIFVDAALRRRLLEVTTRHRRPAVAVCLRVEPELAAARLREAGRGISPTILQRQVALIERFATGAGAAEGWSRIVVVVETDLERRPAVRYTLPRALTYGGPFDVVGDVHGCLPELDDLLDLLGYAPPGPDHARRHPEGRMAVFVGDLADRGPDSAGVFRRVLAMHAAGSALAVRGNHDAKLQRHLQGRQVQITQGLATTLEQLAEAGGDLTVRVRGFLEGLPQVLVLAGGALVVFHAALPRDRVERKDEATRAQTTYGIVRGTTDDGHPIRDTGWTEGWRTGPGEPVAVYGHTPVARPEWRRNALNVDGGCVFGGYLAALRFPEQGLASVSARAVYCASRKVTWRGAPASLADVGWSRR
jgi:protein phosphatase